MEKYLALLVVWQMVCCISSYTIHASTKSPNNTSHSYKSSSHSRKGNAYLNMIDSCWRTDPNWELNRKSLTDCAKGFGSGAVGGKNGAIYVVTDPSDDAVHPKPGTLRHAAIQTQPLWISFARDMIIKLQIELKVNSYKTIDGRGARVEIANGPCISVSYAKNVIIHGLSIHDCKPVLGYDGDGIAVFESVNVWIDHCYFARCTDGLVDVTHGSNYVTISNSYFTQHDKVMLIGHNDNYTPDKNLKHTVILNHFGPGLVERMPRVRFGYAHVANNRYDQWSMYAIGGSANPTILSDGNYFMAPNNPNAKEVTKRETPDWHNWNWCTHIDVFMNGAHFVPSGSGTCEPHYSPSQAFYAARGYEVPALTADAGPLRCVKNQRC